MTASLDESWRSEAEAAQRGGIVTLLQEAAASGHPVMFPGTRESRPGAVAAEPPRAPAGGYTHASAPPFPDHTGPVGRAMMWLIDRLIALMRVAPTR